MNEQQKKDFVDAITLNKLPTIQAMIDENNDYLVRHSINSGQWG